MKELLVYKQSFYQLQSEAKVADFRDFLPKHTYMF